MYPKRKLGRPYGSKTFRETPAVKRAREYLALRICLKKPTDAAKIVAAEWQVSESTVFHDYRRHSARLRADDHVWHGRRLMQHRPNVVAALKRRFVAEFQRALDATAQRLESLGNDAGAQWVRAYDPVTSINGNAWPALLGQMYVDLLDRRSRRKASRL